MKKLLISLCLSFLLTGCISSQTSSVSSQRVVGNDIDAHSCIRSAGYQWCQKENKCARSWEVAKEQKFDNNESLFYVYCNN